MHNPFREKILCALKHTLKNYIITCLNDYLKFKHNYCFYSLIIQITYIPFSTPAFT